MAPVPTHALHARLDAHYVARRAHRGAVAAALAKYAPPADSTVTARRSTAWMAQLAVVVATTNAGRPDEGPVGR